MGEESPSRRDGMGVLPATAGVGASLTPLSPRWPRPSERAGGDGMALPTYHPHTQDALRDHLHSLNLCFPSGLCPLREHPSWGCRGSALREFHAGPGWNGAEGGVGTMKPVNVTVGTATARTERTDSIHLMPRDLGFTAPAKGSALK